MELENDIFKSCRSLLAVCMHAFTSHIHRREWPLKKGLPASGGDLLCRIKKPLRAKDVLTNSRFFVWLFDSKALGIGNCNGEFLFENFSVLVRRQTKLVEAGVRHWQPAGK